MQYIQDLLQAKRLNILEILSSPCRISIKEDGCAFQVSYDKNNKVLLFGKRSNNNQRIEKYITEIDLLTNPTYYYAYNHLKKYISIIREYDILNFELLSVYDKHIISYNSDQDIKIVLLSGYKNDIPITYSDIIKLSKKLHINHIEYLELNRLSDNIIRNILQCADHNSKIFNIFAKEYLKNDNEIEGFVVEFYTPKKTRIYKIQNPLFVESLKSHLSIEKDEKINMNAELVYQYIIDAFMQYSNINLDNYTKFQKLYYVWNFVCIQNVFDKEMLNIVKKITQLKKIQICDDFFKNNYQDLYKTYINTTTDNQLIFKFILLGFQNRRVKNPLWCTLSFQNNVLNVFLDNIFENKQTNN